MRNMRDQLIPEPAALLSHPVHSGIGDQLHHATDIANEIPKKRPVNLN